MYTLRARANVEFVEKKFLSIVMTRTKSKQDWLTLLAYSILIPSARQMFTILLPSTFPIARLAASGVVALNIATEASGKEVDNDIKMNPTAVLPNPVISAILSLFVIVNLLAKSSINIVTPSVRMLRASSNAI